MTIGWTTKAGNDLSKLFDYYLLNASPQTAVRMHNEVVKEAEKLLVFPNLGKVDPQFSNMKYTVRSLVILSGLYRILYFIDQDELVIARIWNCRQNPNRLKL